MKMNMLVKWFQEEYPELVKEMRECSHHGESLNPYHLEGTVFEHTLMVCKQAENAPYEVQIAALLHDIGKPRTRAVNPKNGHVSFYNHDAVSAFMSLEIMEKLGLEDSQKQLIFNMIALHTQMFKLKLDQLTELGTNQPRLLEYLELLRYADHSGRFTSVHSEVDKPRDLEYGFKLPEDKDKEVVILCGLPGSGKSTYVDFEMNANGFCVSRDTLLVSNSRGRTYEEKWQNADQKAIDKLLQCQFQRAKEHGFERVFVDMTHMSKKSRRRSLSHFGRDYKKTCVVFLPTLEEIKLRNEARSGKNIGEDVVDRMMKSFYPPTYSEFDEIIWRF